MAGPEILIAATVFQAVGSLSSAANANKAAEHNAALARRNAQIAADQAGHDVVLQQRQARKAIGAARAAYGAAGVGLEGSPLDVLEDSAAQAELDRQTILYKGRLRAMGYEDEARVESFRGDAALAEGVLRAGSSLLAGASEYKRRYPG